MAKTVNTNYRIDLELVDSEDLVKMQTKLNQWITAGVLLKFDVQPIGSKMLFKVARLKDKPQEKAIAAPKSEAKEEDTPF